MQQKILEEKIVALVDAHGMLPADAPVPVVLMVSGGSDSVALAQLLPALYPRHLYTVLHINHQLRGEDAEKDELFVIQLSRDLDLPCEVRRVDVGVLAAKTGDNLEQAGRIARYREANTLLDALCEQAGIEPALGRIVTAHTLDDRAETFFMRAIVGGGVSGLSSIPHSNGRVIRPLLDCSREKLREHLRSLSPVPPLLRPEVADSPPWREDASNEDTGRLRAFVRHELIPLAKTRNPELLRTVARSLDVLGCENAFIERLTREATGRFVTEGEGALLRIDAALFDEDRALVRRVIKEACERVLPERERITYEHVVLIAEQGNRVGFVTDIPGAVTVANEYGTLVFRRSEPAGDPVSDAWHRELDEGSSQKLPDGRSIMLERVEPRHFRGDPVAYARSGATASRIFIDGGALGRVGGVLTVRRLVVGDRMCPLGMGGRHKLVSDVLVDRKILRRRRSDLLKVCALNDGKDEIVWIIDVCSDERYKVSDDTTSMFSIIVSETEKA